MDMILMPADQLRMLMFEEVSRAVKDNLLTVIPTAIPDELLTPEETAKLLKVSKVTLWQWSKPALGILNPRRIGNQVRYLRSEVMAAARPTRG
ncbi:helix-turn-helix domain-containing protein [Spirosoma jeollabukense]